MAYDVASYIAELKVLTGRPQAAFDSQTIIWLNDLMEAVEVDPEKLWFFDKTVQFTLSLSDVGANGAIIEVPDDLEQVYSMFVVDSDNNGYQEIRPIAERDAKLKYGPSDTGQPERCSVEGESFRFWPPLPDPDDAFGGVYTIELSYKARLTRVSATDDTNKFIDSYHGLVIVGLLAKAWEYLQQYEKARVFWDQWERRWADMRASNVARVLGGEIQFAPLTDVKGSPEDERGGTKLTWGGT